MGERIIPIDPLAYRKFDASYIDSGGFFHPDLFLKYSLKNLSSALGIPPEQVMRNARILEFPILSDEQDLFPRTLPVIFLDGSEDGVSGFLENGMANTYNWYWQVVAIDRDSDRLMGTKTRSLRLVDGYGFDLGVPDLPVTLPDDGVEETGYELYIDSQDMDGSIRLVDVFSGGRLKALVLVSEGRDGWSLEVAELPPDWQKLVRFDGEIREMGNQQGDVEHNGMYLTTGNEKVGPYGGLGTNVIANSSNPVRRYDAEGNRGCGDGGGYPDDQTEAAGEKADPRQAWMERMDKKRPEFTSALMYSDPHGNREYIPSQFFNMALSYVSRLQELRALAGKPLETGIPGVTVDIETMENIRDRNGCVAGSITLLFRGLHLPIREEGRVLDYLAPRTDSDPLHTELKVVIILDRGKMYVMPEAKYSHDQIIRFPRKAEVGLEYFSTDKGAADLLATIEVPPIPQIRTVYDWQQTDLPDYSPVVDRWTEQPLSRPEVKSKSPSKRKPGLKHPYGTTKHGSGVRKSGRQGKRGGKHGHYHG